MFKWITFGLLLFSTFFYANAQEETIDTITISEAPLRSNNLGGKLQNLKAHHSLSETLNQASSVFIKNYGPGSIATSSIRGGSAGHTLVLWNGLPIQNPFLGLLDLSLIDTWAIDDVQLEKGGNSAMWGSGAVGGIIDLQQRNQETASFIFNNQLEYGSFDRLSEKAKLSFKTGNLRSITSFSYLQAQNDFPYPLGRDRIRIQSNAKQVQSNLNQDLYWTIDPSNEMTIHYWRSRADRQVPPTSVQNKSEAFQQDGADRLSLHWKHFRKQGTLRARTAYYIEDLDYYDRQQRIESLTHFETFLSDVDYEIKLKRNQLLALGLSHFRTSVSSPANYENLAIENKSAIFARYQYRWLQLSGRQEIVDGKWIPFVPAAGLSVQLKKHIKINGRVSRNYRLPTLNDRFWVPGGNPNLLPESGWSQELGLVFNRENPQESLTASITGFNRILDNWIQWTQDGPLNINKVWSRGLETEMNSRFTWGKISGNFSASYDYILSTSLIALSFPRINVGDQLFYTPVHQGRASITLNYQKFHFFYRHQFIGASNGINEDLSPFTTADCGLSYKTKPLHFKFQIFNVWDEKYRIIERRPMPGRNYRIILEYTFRKE